MTGELFFGGVKIFGDTGIRAAQKTFMKNFENSIEYRTADIPLKFREKMNKNVPDNFVPARNRLLSLSKRLSKNLERLKRYNTIIKEQERDEVIEPVDNP